MNPADDTRQEQLLAALTREAVAMKAEVVVWPETARPKAVYVRPDHPSSYAMPEVQRLAKDAGITIVAGAEHVVIHGATRRDAYNAVFVVHPDGRLDPIWSAKRYLVPFVEGVPFPSLLGPILSGRGGWARWLAGGFLPGPENVLLPIAGTKLGVSVCYEELFFDLQRGFRNAGAEVQAVITNDAWFGTTFFQAYQANTVRLRAIENRSSFIRAANTGISMFVDPLGRDAERTPLNVESVRVHDLPLTRGRTVYDRVGDVTAWARARGLCDRELRGLEASDERPDQRPHLGAVSRPRPIHVRSCDRSRRHDRGPRSDPARHRHDHPRGARPPISLHD